MNPIQTQRIEGVVVAAFAVVVTVAAGYACWWLLALFLVFDLSMVGYLRGPRVGAFCYNLLGYGLKTTEGFEHTHLGPIGKTKRSAS